MFGCKVYEKIEDMQLDGFLLEKDDILKLATQLMIIKIKNIRTVSTDFFNSIIPRTHTLGDLSRM